MARAALVSSCCWARKAHFSRILIFLNKRKEEMITPVTTLAFVEQHKSVQEILGVQWSCSGRLFEFCLEGETANDQCS